MPISQRWKWRRCGPHDSLLSQEQASSLHTKARGCTKRPGKRAEEAKSEAGNMVE
jgi:hypothetical protein